MENSEAIPDVELPELEEAFPDPEPQPEPIPNLGSSKKELRPPPPLETADLVTMVVSYSRARACETKDVYRRTDWNLVAEKMGWTRAQLDEFRKANAHLIACAEEMVLMETPGVKPPTDGDLIGGPDVDALSSAPTEEQMANAIALADNNITKGLKSLGLKEKEVEIANALQAFNKDHFKESMDMISSGVLVTAIKLQVQQREIEERLEFVRSLIKEFGEFQSDDRQSWVKEERLLMLQYLEAGDLLNKIQDTWYRGAAYLAVIRARLRGEKNVNGRGVMQLRTQRSNKPGFRPSVVINQEGESSDEPN